MSLKIKPTDGRKRKLGKKGTINCRCLHSEELTDQYGNKIEVYLHVGKGWRMRRVYGCDSA